MRRDYFTCVFLLCICAALFFVCFVPIYFSYGMIVPREFGTIERICSWVYAFCILIIIPGFAAYRKQIWVTVGLSAYGLLALLPVWLLPGLADKLSGDNSNVLTVIWNFILKSIYEMVNAPFAGMSAAIGDDVAAGLSRKILPAALIIYAAVQVFRFYRDAYVAEQLDPTSVVDSTARENNRVKRQDGRGVRDVTTPEVLGTVISAPAAEKPERSS